jgi:hypothetical protein
VLLQGNLELRQLLLDALDHSVHDFLAGEFLPPREVASQVVHLLPRPQALLTQGLALPLKIPHAFGEELLLPPSAGVVVAQDVLEFVEGGVLLLLLGRVLVLAVVLDVDEVLVQGVGLAALGVHL